MLTNITEVVAVLSTSWKWHIWNNLVSTLWIFIRHSLPLKAPTHKNIKHLIFTTKWSHNQNIDMKPQTFVSADLAALTFEMPSPSNVYAIMWM